jgi:hypothetical protein
MMKRYIITLLTILGIAASFVGTAYAETILGFTTTNQLIRFDSATPGTIANSVGITGLQAGETVLGIDRRPATDTLYAIGSTSRLYTLNTTTGAATQVGSAGAFTLSGTAFGMDINPSVDRIRVVGNTGQNIRLNPNDGTLAGTDTPLTFAPADPNFGALPRLVGSAYTNNVNGGTPTSLYGIDSNLDILVLQGSLNGTPVSPNTGQLFTVGALGFNTSDLVGFDISGVSGLAFASLTSPGAGSSSLFTINLNNGAATLVGTIGGGVPLGGLSVSVGSTTVPETSSLTLLLTGLTGTAFALRKRAKRD